MKSISFEQKLLWLLLFISFLLFSCADKMEEHYEKPDWLKGSAWNVLESEGNYSVFMEGIELSGFRPYLDGKGILTVMAPDDEAFSHYLSARGYAAIGDMPKEELKKLIGFHLLYYSYNKTNMVNFRPEGQGATDGGAEILDPGMYYKFRTRSSNPVTKEVDPTTGKNITVYHLERFIPVFSHYFFSSKKIDAKKNYEFFYPNSTWTGDQGFNVSEASVKQYELIANNGYVYTINKVLEPLETIYDELKKNPNYSDFLELYNSYSSYEYDATLTNDYGSTLGVDSLYLHKHKDPLPPIALEWPVSNYLRLDTLAYKSYSVFAPSNNAMKTFYDSFWKNGGYTSVKDVDPLITRTLLSEYVYGGSVVFPEEIETGKIMSNSGVAFNFDPYSATDKKMCVNGSFYGLNEISGPSLFTSVVGPAFKEKQYICFLYAANGSNLLKSFGSKQKYTLLIPSNADFNTSGYYLNSYLSGNVLEENTEEGPAEVLAEDLKNIVNVHTMVGETTFKTTGTQICPNVIPYNYWYIKDGKITTSENFNKILDPDNSIDPFVPFTEVKNNGQPWSNGKAYTYQGGSLGLLDSGLDNADGLQKALSISNDMRYPYFAFSQLLKKAGLISGSAIVGISGRFIAFIPTNEVIQQALAEDKIPGVTGASFDAAGTLTGTFNTTVLKEYLYNYFVAASQITSYPYPGSEMKSGEYFNYQGGIIIYTDSGASLSIQLKGNSTVSPVSPLYYYFPFAYNDGCFHLINSLL